MSMRLRMLPKSRKQQRTRKPEVEKEGWEYFALNGVR